ncbi:protein tramtrack, beta isoform-like isoform X2 [Harmonia axyridis]|nr:protein tramtrack, beta isoform-like isoform X2 [Harmonia axyridis]XP_045462333.1 protein tramtrack, beta isoform-like isoform X2 [Harmonia axyridis]
MATSATHTQQFALKWNNFHSNLTSGFHDLFEASDLVDVTLATDGKFLKAHKIVLSICSPFFKEMFKVNPCKHPIVILKGVGHEHMKDILEFMYLGEVSVLRENLTCFLRTAELLQVKGLTGDDSNESSSKEDEKFDGENDEEEEYANMMQNMQYNQQYNSVDNLINMTPHYPPIAATCPSSPPLSVHPQSQNTSIPPTNNKRTKGFNGNGTNGKRSKIDSNGNQSIPSKSLPVNLIKTEDENVNQKKKGVSSNQDSEPEFTDISNIKSDRSSADEESVDKPVESKSNFLADSFVDQGKPDAKYGLKPSYLCEMCPKRFSRRDHLRTHEKNIHGEDAGPFVCIVCSQLYKNTESLRKHISKFHLAPKSDSLVLNSARA